MVHHGGRVIGSAVFWHPSAHIGQVGVELFQLQFRIEYAEIGGGVGAAASAPLPASYVARQFVVEQVACKPGLSPAPVDEQVFGEKAGGDHADAVVHVACLLQLAHAGVHQRVAGCAIAPALEIPFVISPLDAVVGGFEGMIDRVGEMPQDHAVEFTPDEFVEVGLVELEGSAGLFADADGAEAKVHAKAGSGVEAGEIPLFVILQDDALWHLAGRKWNAGRGESKGFERRNGAGRYFGEAIEILFRGVGAQEKRIRTGATIGKLFPPLACVGGKDRVGFAVAFDHFLFFENHLVFVGVEGDAVGGEQLLDAGVALAGIGFVVVVGEYGCGLPVGDPLFPDRFGVAVGHYDLAAELSQFLGESADFLVDELDACVALVWQAVEDVAVEDENRHHGPGAAQGVVKASVVVQAQVASKPEEGYFFHGGWELPAQRGEAEKVLRCGRCLRRICAGCGNG
ncbi:MAG: hypothetical protein KatS3mg101_1118 [Patescibacteria group bacterium]|nr:MAG: hypothetical protein KatS3mg101_1118 [Patescibacteria group bacterium]